ncbi:hypothetical protein [Brevibacillus laterosporus]|uniref:hypothetical protein n=1 Tax=Brevibacillus laterosporus TaxID=1465 RepID=UPI001585EA33|nr:hypothetical protein [Brevibacillus laterosporus]
MDLISVLSSVVCFLALVVTFNHLDLQIRIKNILDLKIKADKENDVEEKNSTDRIPK